MNNYRSEPVLCSVMSSAAHSQTNRRLAKDIVWRWVGQRWPLLRPSAASMERSHLESTSARGDLSVKTSEDGASWTLTVNTWEREGAPVWTSSVVVADTGTCDIVALETSCSDISAARVVAPPALLGHWIERLDLKDGGVRITGEPLHVKDEQQAQTLFEHVTHPERKLSVVLLAAKGESQYYGVDPRMLAQAVRGLAHVACLAAPAVQEWSRLCGRSLSPVHGTGRILTPGPAMQPPAAAQPPARFTVHPAGDTAGDEKSDANRTRNRLRRQLCAMSVAAHWRGAHRLEQ